MQENCAQGVHSNKASRLYATKPSRGPCHTIRHLLPALVDIGRYQVSLLPLSSTPSVNKSTKTNQNCQESGAVTTQVPLSIDSRTGTLPHDLPFHFCIRWTTTTTTTTMIERIEVQNYDRLTIELTHRNYKVSTNLTHRVGDQTRRKSKITTDWRMVWRIERPKLRLISHRAESGTSSRESGKYYREKDKS